MQNDKGVKVDLYIPRKWCVASSCCVVVESRACVLALNDVARARNSNYTNRLIHAKDHASVQINIGHVDEKGARRPPTCCSRSRWRPRFFRARTRSRCRLASLVVLAGLYTGDFTSYALVGYLRARSESGANDGARAARLVSWRPPLRLRGEKSFVAHRAMAASVLCTWCRAQTRRSTSWRRATVSSR